MTYLRNFLLSFVIALPLLFVYSHVGQTQDPYQNMVNQTCGTDYGCVLCHIEPKGGGVLSFDGMGFSDSGHDPHYFCP